ncbi:mitochondrial carrier [Serendipita vermifera]|nr:mitochondrial carrier [Serendipita vermifera]
MSVPSVESILAAGLAACVATTASNPAEVAKTRLQLQGELAKGGFKPVYAGPLDVVLKTWKNEGVQGVQRGLGAAYAYSSLLQICIVGLYEPFRQSLNLGLGKGPQDRLPFTTIAAGTCTGIIGAFLGNPLFLVKARMQAYSPSLPVGTQRHYNSGLHALRTICAEEGFKGLFRGSKAAMFRTSLGTSVQMPTFFFTKRVLVEQGLMKPENPLVVISSSAAAGAAVCLSMSPADTVLTRLYNQPVARQNGSAVGMLYKGPFDCLSKVVRIEGFFALYKGALAHFLRITPHITILLTANEYLLRWRGPAQGHP